MKQDDLKETIKELTLILLYLTSWEEKDFGIQYRRTWKGYDFDILNKLTEEDLVRGSLRSKSVIMTDGGINNAKDLLKKYGVHDG